MIDYKEWSLLDNILILKRFIAKGATLLGTDTEPYQYRHSPSLGAYKTERDEIVGVSVGFNQLVDTTDTSVTVPSGHKYIARINGTWSVGTSSGTALTADGSNNDMVIDLTAMLGSTIADYIVTQGNTNGVAFFRKYFGDDYYPFDSGSIRSVEGLVSHDMVGKNRLNVNAKNTANGYIAGSYLNNVGDAIVPSSGLVWNTSEYIRVEPSTEYVLSTLATTSSGTPSIVEYDENFNYRQGTPYANTAVIHILTSSKTRYVRISIMESIASQMQLEFGSTATDYAPYEKHSYPLDSTITLRGLLKLEDGKLKADGDIYKASGEVVRNWGERAYQEGDVSDFTTMITDGTTTVYKLDTPTTETAQPYAKTQKVDPSGTEEYVSTGVVPVGHNTEYYG